MIRCIAKLKTHWSAVLCTLGVVFASTFIFSASSAQITVEKSCGFARTSLPLSVPEIPDTFRDAICRTDLPVINIRRSESSSNPPLNSNSAVLFKRTFVDINCIFHKYGEDVQLIVFQRLINNSIPVRAGPCCC